MTEILLEKISLLDGDKMPPAHIYAELISHCAYNKEMSANEARQTFGLHSVGQWRRVIDPQYSEQNFRLAITSKKPRNEIIGYFTSKNLKLSDDTIYAVIFNPIKNFTDDRCYNMYHMFGYTFRILDYNSFSQTSLDELIPIRFDEMVDNAPKLFECICQYHNIFK